MYGFNENRKLNIYRTTHRHRICEYTTIDNPRCIANMRNTTMVIYKVQAQLLAAYYKCIVHIIQYEHLTSRYGPRHQRIITGIYTSVVRAVKPFAQICTCEREGIYISAPSA